MVAYCRFCDLVSEVLFPLTNDFVGWVRVFGRGHYVCCGRCVLTEIYDDNEIPFTY